MTVKPKHQRLILVSLALIALVGAVLLAMWGLQDRAAYFVTPTDIAAGKGHDGKALRLGGMVVKGSLQRDPDGVTIRFRVSDTKSEIPVVFHGITPDLFKEGNGAVAEGKLQPDGTFAADTILAKHDERYMPPQMANEVMPK